MIERAIFAAGCFWGVEEAFRKVDGVRATRAGYSGGSSHDPTYEDVCSGRTGHAESVEVTFDPDRVSFEQLLDRFWAIHDPTTRDRQGPDVGSQYRSAVFYLTEEQRAAAEKSKASLETSGRFRGKMIVTEIVRAGPFYEAEEYHQRYFEKTGRRGCWSHCNSPDSAQANSQKKI